uniref:Uncharacterized protein n=1 Tax=Anguilla anguilla TaxID=7936 RepID=A0A0E9RYC8_ANGAN
MLIAYFSFQVYFHSNYVEYKNKLLKGKKSKYLISLCFIYSTAWRPCQFQHFSSDLCPFSL